MRIDIEYGHYTVDEQNRYHSFDDEPAIVVESHTEEIEQDEFIHVDGYKAWYKHGQLHREGNPAIIRNTGETYWYKEGNIILN